MLGEDLKKFLRKTSLAAAGLLTGVGLTLVLTQYTGVVEVRLTTEESYLRVDGSRICRPQAEPIKEIK